MSRGKKLYFVNTGITESSFLVEAKDPSNVRSRMARRKGLVAGTYSIERITNNIKRVLND